jgi:phosphoribosylformylglycinamidine (FGAM) synthase PurS component
MLAARAIVERLAGEVFANPIIETWEVAPASLVAVAG